MQLDGPCIDVQPTTTPIRVQLPNGGTMTSTHTGLLPLPLLPLKARQTNLFPTLQAGSLLSIGQLCDANCTAHFTNTSVTIKRGLQTIATGQRSPNGLWNIPLPTTPILPVANMTTLAHQTASDRIAFLHAAAGYPVLSTWLKAIAHGFFATWPGLTVPIVKRHLPKSTITAKGHLDQQRANQRSTEAITPSTDAITRCIMPTSNPTQIPSPRFHDIYADCQPITGKIFSDLPGRFVVPSSRGHNYLLIVYDHDSNAILAEPLKNRSAKSIVDGFKVLYNILLSRGLKPQLQRLDNEASALLRAFLTEKQIDYQLAPPHLHRRNAAERAIRTFKNHFVSILCGTDPQFPLHLWDRLVPQTLVTLNLLRSSRLNPSLSAQAQLHGAFDFNRTPLGPLGTKVIVHEKPDVRGTWAPHGIPGWYVGAAPNHYRCYQVHIIKTGASRIADTLEWFPYHTPLPKTASIDAARTAAYDLVQALQHPSPATPFAGLDPTTLAALNDLATIFDTASQPVAPPNPAPKRTPPPPPTGDDPPAATPPRVPSPSPLPAPAPPPRVLAPNQPHSTNKQPYPSPRVPITPTYASATANPGQRRRRAAKIAKTPSPPPAPATPAGRHYQTRFQLRRAAANSALCPPPWIAHAVLDPKTGANLSYRKLLEGPDANIWINGCANEIGRLAQGRTGTPIQGTDTIHFLSHTKLPKGRKATYLRIVVDYRPQKKEPNRVRFTAGGDQVDYPGNVSTPTADITTAKIVLNSTVSTPGATYSCFDISNFYLNTPMERYEYMRIPIWAIPACIMTQYHLAPLVHNGHVLVEIRKGMYGLPQAGQLAYERLAIHLAKYGYTPARHTPGLWRHHTRPILFSLVVDDFGVKTVGRAHAQHLLTALRTLYSVTADWTGSTYLGLHLEWDYLRRTCDISMPNYITTALHRFQHPPPARAEDSPHNWIAPDYGSTIQLTPLVDDTPALDAAGITRLQQIVGTLLYYARAVDATMLPALGTLAAAQSHGTEATAKALTKLLNYCATHRDATIRYHASDMVLWISSDASYLSESKARSRVGGHFFLSALPPDPSKPPTTLAPNNGAIHTVSSILKNVMSSATESEFAGLFHNARDGVTLRTTLEEMGHPQPATPLQTDNSTATGITNGTVRQRKSKAMDMRFYWIQDRVKQKQFSVFWEKGAANLGDYFTKHHSTAHHRMIRPTYLQVVDRAKLANLVTRIPPTDVKVLLPARVCSYPSGFPTPGSPVLHPTNFNRVIRITANGCQPPIQILRKRLQRLLHKIDHNL